MGPYFVTPGFSEGPSYLEAPKALNRGTKKRKAEAKTQYPKTESISIIGSMSFGQFGGPGSC